MELCSHWEHRKRVKVYTKTGTIKNKVKTAKLKDILGLGSKDNERE